MVSSFSQAIQSAGITPPSQVIADGVLHRFHVDGDRVKTENGWYVFFDDPPAGAFGCWKRNISETWSSRPSHTLTEAEKADYRAKMEAVKQQREAEQARIHAEAREKALEVWQQAQPAPESHSYLTMKAVASHGLRFSRNKLVVPLRDCDGTLHGLQFISSDGDKRFLFGSAITGHYFSIGGKPDSVLYICEGYATGASIHEVTGASVAVAFNAGNLLPVAKVLKEKIPNVKIVVCGDKDEWTKGNPGVTKAKEAAAAVCGVLALPTFRDTSDQPTDFNDLQRLEGAAEVRRQIGMASAPDREKPAESLDVLRGCDVKIEPIRWLWNLWLAVAKLIILAGAPGTGKTTLALWIAGVLTRGGKWPDGTQAPLADVAIWSGEDDPQDTLAPRLKAAGADMYRVHFIRGIKTGEERRSFDPANDMTALTAYLRNHSEIKFLIVDSVVSAVSGDSHKNTEVRRSLQPLVDLGAFCDCAVLGISHFSKGTSGRDPLERVTGSIAFGALARIVLAAAKLADDEEGKRLFARAKSNIGPDSGGWHYRLENVELDDYPGVVTSRVVWCGAVEGTARELLDTAETAEDSEEKTARGEAKEFLLGILSDGPAAAKKVFADARSIGISERTLKRAKSSLGILTEKVGMGGGWQWSLPRRGPKNSEEGQQKLMEPFGESGPLREHIAGTQEVMHLTAADFEEAL